MYKLIRVELISGSTTWVMIDCHTKLPSLYPVRYLVDHLSKRSASTQLAGLQGIQSFYEFWLYKYGVTFCHAFHSANKNPLIAIEELDNFYAYLVESRRNCVFGVKTNKQMSNETAAVKVRSVVLFVRFLVMTYVSSRYLDYSLTEITDAAGKLLTRLDWVKGNYKTLQPNQISGNDRPMWQFSSLNEEQLAFIYDVLRPETIKTKNPLNPFPPGNLQIRNFLIVHLLFNYGLRVSELLLIELSSLKSNIQGTKFSLIITSASRESDDPRLRKPSLKNNNAHRVIELLEQDHGYLMRYINSVRPSTPSTFLFLSSQAGHAPLSYHSIHAIFSIIQSVTSANRPQYMDSKNTDSVKKITPHVARHTWAYTTLRRLYEIKFNSLKKTSRAAGIDLSISGLMEEAKSELRLMGGWSLSSRMPDHYAKRFIAERANILNVERLERGKHEPSYTEGLW
jgi:integrase